MSESVLSFLSRPGVWFCGLAAAAFLALYWALRGAPLGQSSGEEGTDEAPGRGYRDRVAALAILGLLLIVGGGYAATSAGVPWSIPLFAAGFGLLIVLVQRNRRYRHASPTLRRVVDFADSALTATLLGGILIVGNVLAFKYGDRPFDFTRERVFSLESLTVNQLRSLDRPARFTAFFEQGGRSAKQLDRVVQLLQLFRAENPGKVSVEVLHPFKNPYEYDELKKRAPGVAVVPSGGVLIEYGEGKTAERLVVPNAELFAPPMASPGARPETTFRGEDALTSALIRLREGKRAKVGFVTGHGEPSIHDMDPNRPGLGLLRARLESIGIDPVVVSPATQDLPRGLAVVIVAAPKTRFQPVEVDRLKGYLDAGGHLILLLDGRNPGGLDAWLKAENIEFGTEPIVDPRNSLRNPSLPLAPVMGDSHHPIVEPLLRESVLVPGATPMWLVGQPRPGVMQGSPPNPAYVASAILRTSPDSWGETDPRAPRLRRDAKDVPGPLVVGAAVASAPGPDEPQGVGRPRMVVFSSPLLADNWAVAHDEVNLDLLVNAINWLRGRPDLQGLTPRTHQTLVLSADPGLRARLVMIPTVLAFALILGLGVSTYLARRA
jgi:hypothetical protein